MLFSDSIFQLTLRSCTICGYDLSMNEQNSAQNDEIIEKIARLVEEKGWNQEEFSRRTGLNRQTVRQILQPSSDRKLRNNTVAACARALELSVHDLRTMSLDRLLLRVTSKEPLPEDDAMLWLFERVTEPALRSWLERNPERSKDLTTEEIDELLEMKGPGGALANSGGEHFVSELERRRELLEQVRNIAKTEYLDLLEQFVGLLYDKVYSTQQR